MSENNLRKEFEEEIQSIQEEEILSSKYRKKKLLQYTVRTTLAIIIYVIFWEYNWVRWSVWVYVPLNLLSLVAIFGMPYLVKRKLGKTQKKIEEMEVLLKDSEETPDRLG